MTLQNLSFSLIDKKPFPQECIIAKEFNGNVLLFRNSIDEHSRTMKFSKKDLQEKDEFDLNQQINRLALNL